MLGQSKARLGWSKARLSPSEARLSPSEARLGQSKDGLGDPPVPGGEIPLTPGPPYPPPQAGEVALRLRRGGPEMRPRAPFSTSVSQ